jgi:hypothetical protein
MTSQSNAAMLQSQTRVGTKLTDDLPKIHAQHLVTAYLACPYASNFRDEAIFRHQVASMVAAQLMIQHPHYSVFSPISQSEAIAEYIPEEFNVYEFWIEKDLAMVRQCQELLVLPMHNYKSRGVQREVHLARDLKIPVKFVIINDASFVVDRRALEEDKFFQQFCQGTLTLEMPKR